MAGASSTYHSNNVPAQPLRYFLQFTVVYRQIESFPPFTKTFAQYFVNIIYDNKSMGVNRRHKIL